MRRDPAELPFTGRAQRRAQVPDTDRQVSYVNGRAYLRETSRHDLDNTITPDEQKVLRQRRLEAAEERQARNSANFARALELGAALKALRALADE